ncbi:hypothetical protein [Nitrospira sp. Kam-Ns4a]
MDSIAALWEVHRNAGWPIFTTTSEGELMTLDTVISGCATYFLDSADGLDRQRIEILADCLADLDTLLPDIPEEAVGYFERLRTLASLVLDAHRQP